MDRRVEEDMAKHMKATSLQLCFRCYSGSTYRWALLTIILCLAVSIFNFRTVFHLTGTRSEPMLRPLDPVAASRWDCEHLESDALVAPAGFRVAIMVLAMKDSSQKFHDGLAVLALSVKHAFKRSSIKVSLIAVTELGIGEDEVQLMSKLGFIVKIYPLPVPRDRIRNAFAKDEMTKNCHGANLCQEKEMMKLYGVSLTEYDRVVICDADLMFLRNIDNLLLRSSHPVFATYDYELDRGTNSALPVVNGGFIVVQPSESDFQALVSLVEEGDFRSGSGWRGMQVGWAYGGVAIQGIFAYFYNKEALEQGERPVRRKDLACNMTIGPLSTRIGVLDRSVYDVIDTQDLVAAVESNEVSYEKVRVFHFTGNCLKPWDCNQPQSKLCKQVTDHWWRLHAELGGKRGCHGAEGYIPLP